MCVVARTIVDAVGIQAVHERYYDGEVIVIGMPGRRVTVTPNQPVITMRGVVPARELTLHDKVEICAMGSGQMASMLANAAGFNAMYMLTGTADSYHGDGQERPTVIYTSDDAPYDTPEIGRMRVAAIADIMLIGTERHRGKVYTFTTATETFGANGVIMRV